MGAFAVLVLFLIVLRSCTGGGGRNDGGACMSDLLTHVPESVDTFAGVDYLGARNNGFDDDGSLEDIGDSMTDTGVIPDPVTTTWRIKQLASAEKFEAQTGVAPGDIRCSVGTERLAVLDGSFDAAKVKGSDAGSSGRLASDGDLLTLSAGDVQAADLLEPAAGGGLAGDEAVLGVLESLREREAYSVIIQRGDGDAKNGRALAAGVGAAGRGDDRRVEIAWIFTDDDAAAEGRPEVAETINNVLRGTLSIRNSDLDLEGPMVIASLPSRLAPDLQSIFDAGTRLVPEP